MDEIIDLDAEALCASSIEEIIDHITHLSSDAEKTAACLSILESLDSSKDDIYERMNTILNLLYSNPNWWVGRFTKTRLDSQVQNITHDLEQNIPKIRERRLERIRSKVAKKFPNPFDAVGRLNDAFIQRLLVSKRGSRTQKRLQGSDCIRAINIDTPHTFDDEIHQSLSLTHDPATGLLQPTEYSSLGQPFLFSNRHLGAYPGFYPPILHSPDENAAPSPSPGPSSSLTSPSEYVSSSDDSPFSILSPNEDERSKLRCRCSINSRDRIIQMYQNHKWKPISKEITEEIHYVLGQVLNELSSVCARHQRYVAVLCGLKVKFISQKELHRRMHTLKEASLSGVDALHDLKHNVSRSWFTSRHRILKKTDALGHYKFAPVRNLPDVPFSIRLRDDRFQSATISFLTSQAVTGAEQWEGASAIRSWEERGSINIPIFKWWRSVHDGHLGRIIDEEMDMYKHHTRRHLFGNENKGWLVTAYYSIAQQLASQDPVHYAMYTLLRPDHCTSLVSYPYYAKYSDFDARYPNTGAFEHIDHNIDNLMNSNSRVSSQIQGSISLDDETENNCTKIAPGYHKPGALANWWKTVAEGERKSGAVTRIPPSAGLNWEPVPCKRGEARLTMPQIPHGAYPRYEGMERRRCVLTWLSKVDDNHTTLPNTERGAGTVGDLILSRVACTAPKTGPSGKFTLNANLPYRFPACVRLGSLGALSDVLLGFRHWDSPEFIAEQELLFHEDKSIALQFILDWRQNAYSIACESFRIIKDAEQHIFQTKSFWNSAGIEYPFESDSSNGEDEIKNKFT